MKCLIRLINMLFYLFACLCPDIWSVHWKYNFPFNLGLFSCFFTWGSSIDLYLVVYLIVLYYSEIIRCVLISAFSMGGLIQTFMSTYTCLMTYWWFIFCLLIFIVWNGLFLLIFVFFGKGCNVTLFAYMVIYTYV